MLEQIKPSTRKSINNKCLYFREKGRDGQCQLSSPAKTAVEKGTLERPDEAIQLLRLTTDNEDHVQRIEIGIRTKEMKAEHSRLPVVSHKPGLL